MIVAKNISKTFNRTRVLSDVSFDVRPGEVFGITGRNGSGKSTLLKIVAGLLTPSSGSLEYAVDGNGVSREHLHMHIGFVAPYLTLFEEFSAEENIGIFAGIRGLSVSSADARRLLERVGLPGTRRDPIRAFSSGMKQRMKLVFAIVHSPRILLLDEPISNLDKSGIEVVHSVVSEFRSRGCVVIATNDQSDIDQCDRTIALS